MKRKNVIRLLITVFLAISVMLAFVSCGGNPTPECTTHVDNNGDGVCDTEGCGKTVEHTDTPTADAFNENGELLLFKDGTPTFQFVVGTDVISKKGDIEELAALLQGLSKDGSEIKTVAQGEGEPQAVEILIGSVTNRGDECNINKYSYGKKGYAVKQIGTKIVVIGGSDGAIADAINYLKSTVFGIKKNNDKFDTFSMKSDTNFDKPQTDYKTTSITVDGVSISEYVIYRSAKDSTAGTIAENFRNALYENEGIWLEIVNKEPTEKAVKFITAENDGYGDGFTAFVDDKGNIVFECEFSYKFKETAEKSYESKIVKTNNKTVKLSKDQVIDSVDIRNIYYEDFGANGTDEICDFNAIKEAHKTANKYGHTVNADPDATYYIGTYVGSESITVQTNTNWNGCKFIINDRGLTRNDPEYKRPIFAITSSVSNSNKEYTGETVPISELRLGATNVGFKPGFAALVYVENSNVLQFVRNGGGQNNDPGKPQQEVILVDAEGNIDPTTPVQWDYSVVTRVKVVRIDDAPITVSGGGEGVYTTFTTIFNGSPYGENDSYLSRNIKVTRSNVTVTNFIHIIEGEEDCQSGQPYDGFTCTDMCNNVTWQGLTLQRYKTWNNTVSGNQVARSYEVRAGHCANLTYKDCTQSNFFHEPNGGTRGNGMMGTNYCRNITLDNCKFNTFDAHCGVYNASVINSTVAYISLIGQGTFILKGTTVYATRVDTSESRVIELRPDYGSSFNGTLIVEDVTVKYKDNRDVVLMYGTWSDTYRGFKTHLPGKVYLNNIQLVQVKFENDVESTVGTNLKELYLVTRGMSTTTDDYSDPTLINPYEGTKELYVTNCGNLKIFIPTSPQFKVMRENIHYDNNNDGVCDGSGSCKCSEDNFATCTPPKNDEE